MKSVVLKNLLWLAILAALVIAVVADWPCTPCLN